MRDEGGEGEKEEIKEAAGKGIGIEAIFWLDSKDSKRFFFAPGSLSTFISAKFGFFACNFLPSIITRFATSYCDPFPYARFFFSFLPFSFLFLYN